MRTKHCSRCGTTDHWTLQHCKVCGGLGHHSLSHNKENKFRCKTCGQLGHNSKYHGEKATNNRMYPVVKGRKRCSVCHEVGHTRMRHDCKPTTRRFHDGEKHHCSLCGGSGHNRGLHSKEERAATESQILGNGERLCRKCQRVLSGEHFNHIEYRARSGRMISRFSLYCFECTKRVKVDLQPNASQLERVLRHRFLAASRRAQVRGFSFDITVPFLVELFQKQDGKCAYSMMPLELISGSTSVSIDRRDSTKGYTKDNVVLACAEINTMKNSLSEETFLVLCRAVTENCAKKL